MASRGKIFRGGGAGAVWARNGAETPVNKGWNEYPGGGDGRADGAKNFSAARRTAHGGAGSGRRARGGERLADSG